MPRKAREKSQTNCYHIVARGLNKSAIFREKGEKTRILNLIKENYNEYNVKIYAYCIMSNHFHLLLEAELDDLALFISKISASYAHYYNYKHKRVGYVFQGSYRIQWFENDGYFWNCFRYIQINPIKARVCNNIEEYIYSSGEEYYRPHKEGEEIISKEICCMKNKKFETWKDFVDFHKLNDRNFFIDLPEDELKQRVRIANEILWDMQYEMRLPAIEILNYAKTRTIFEDKIRDFFNISKKSVQEIRKLIESELGQGN